jgi:hypothetical protein
MRATAMRVAVAQFPQLIDHAVPAFPRRQRRLEERPVLLAGDEIEEMRDIKVCEDVRGIWRRHVLVDLVASSSRRCLVS